jgi:hypothetical protein
MLGKGSSTIWRHSPSVPPTGGFGGSDAATSKQRLNYHELNFALQILSWTETAQRGLRCLNAISYVLRPDLGYSFGQRSAEVLGEMTQGSPRGRRLANASAWLGFSSALALGPSRKKHLHQDNPHIGNAEMSSSCHASTSRPMVVALLASVSVGMTTASAHVMGALKSRPLAEA